MSLVSFSIKTFDGLAPTLADSQRDKPSIVRGRNFRYQYSGPYSGWGNSVIAPSVPNLYEYPQIALFRILNHTILLTPEGVWEHTPEDCLAPEATPWNRVFKCTPTKWKSCADQNYPWTKAFVGGSWYFSHPSVGIIKYDKDHCKWSKVSLSCETKDPSFDTMSNTGTHSGQIIAEPIYGITQSNNRLVVLAYDTVSWSRIDQGDSLHCDMYKGSGFQNLSMAKFGIPLAVHEVANGFNVYTTNGFFNAAHLTSAVAFKVTHISDTYVPLSPTTIIQHDNKSNIFLAKDGLHVTSGQYPKPFAPEVGKWIAEQLLIQTTELNDTTSFRLFYHPETHELFLSCYGDDLVYSHSLVFNDEYQQWASFDQPHRFIGPVNLSTSRIHTTSLGFVAGDGTIRRFDGSSYNGRPSQPLDSFITIYPINLPSQEDYQKNTTLVKVTIHGEPNISNDETYPALADQYAAVTTSSSNYHVIYNSTSVCNMPYSAATPSIKEDVITDNRQTFICNSSEIDHNITMTAQLHGQFYVLRGLDVQFNVTT